jgi:hypothetical protein
LLPHDFPSVVRVIWIKRPCVLLGLRDGLTTILASPKFLYRAERLPDHIAANSIYRISDLDLASRLSFFLWSSIPDEELLTLATEGKLNNPAVLRRQARRMIAQFVRENATVYADQSALQRRPCGCLH